MKYSSFQIQDKFPELFMIAPGAKKIYLVGGIVRDLVLGKENKDIDLVCDFDTRIIARLLAEITKGAFYVLDNDRNTCRVISFENGVKKVFDFARLQGSDLQADLAARDFTINAMAVDLVKPDELIDPMGGVVDLKAGVLRPCSSLSFSSDPVRVIRAARYAAAYNLRIEPSTNRLIRDAVNLLTNISAERNRDELFKVLDLDSPLGALRNLNDFGVLLYFGIEIDPKASLEKCTWLVRFMDLILSKVESNKPANTYEVQFTGELDGYFSRYSEIITQRNASDRNFRQLIILACLLQNAGYSAGLQMIEKLSLSREESDHLMMLMTQRNLLAALAEKSELSARDLYRYFQATGEAGLELSLITLAALAAEGEVHRWENYLSRAKTIFDTWFEHQNRIHPKPLLNGTELMKNFALAPGPIVGKLLGGLKEEQAAGLIKNRPQALKWVEDQLKFERNSKGSIQ